MTSPRHPSKYGMSRWFNWLFYEVVPTVISTNYTSSTYSNGEVKFPYFHQDIIIEFIVLFPTHDKYIRVEYRQLQP
ncbi:hypothetical protein [Scytonema sp. HK-05]|uniref:hypothetical protein n=1 Tax=Scytonema sp. HK-05 TaxID=1137095 RepID=UPI0018E98487|nr:hypothetical protein [Scytonema sp. HK-05]